MRSTDTDTGTPTIRRGMHVAVKSGTGVARGDSFRAVNGVEYVVVQLDGLATYANRKYKVSSIYSAYMPEAAQA